MATLRAPMALTRYASVGSSSETVRPARAAQLMTVTGRFFAANSLTASKSVTSTSTSVGSTS